VNIQPLPTQTAPHSLQTWLTVERAIFVLVLLVAAALRFFLLTNQPLNALEAANSWTAWLVATGEPLPMAVAPNSPLLYSLYTIAYWVLGGSDALARAIPALCGVGTVWLLWYWRDWLGRETALIAAGLVAIDPWLVTYSRLGDSIGISLFLGMLTLTALLRLATLLEAAPVPTEPLSVPPLVDEGAQAVSPNGAEKPPITRVNRLVERWQQIAAIALGLLLISGPQMWNWLVVLALFTVIVLPAAVWQPLVAQRALWLLLIGVAVGGATGWLANPAGIGALSTSLTVWLSGWFAGPEPYPLQWLWIRVVTDIPLITFFGLIGIGVAWRSRSGDRGPQTRFLAAWLLWGLILVLVPGRSPLVLAMVGLPLLFFAAQRLTSLIQEAQFGVAWRENGLLALVLAILFVVFAFLLASFSQSPTLNNSLARTLILILVFIILLVLAYALWINGRQARLVIGSGMGLLLLLWTINSTWALNQHFDLYYPDGFFAGYTNPDVRALADAVAMLSAQRHGDATELALQVEMAGVPDPVLGWYLRNMRNLTWVLAPGLVNGQSPTVVITPADSTGVDGLRSNYLGSSYALHDRWLPTLLIGAETVAPPPDAGFFERMQQRLNGFWSARVHNLLRWMIYHRTQTLPPTEQVVLWVATPGEAGQ
jgi:hypothetical protein